MLYINIHCVTVPASDHQVLGTLGGGKKTKISKLNWHTSCPRSPSHSDSGDTFIFHVSSWEVLPLDDLIGVSMIKFCIFLLKLSKI